MARSASRTRTICGIAPDPNWNPTGIKALAVSHPVEEGMDEALPLNRLGRPALLRSLGLAIALAVLIGGFALLQDPQARESARSWTAGYTTEVVNAARLIE